MRLHDAMATTALATFVVLGCGCSTTVTTSPAAPAETTPSGCTPDDTVDCEGGGDGWTCPAGNNPQDDGVGLACSVPQPDGSNDDFCCITWTTASTSCVPVDTSSFDSNASFACAFGSYGYQCDANDDPTSLDSSLTCNPSSAPGVADPDGVHFDFCCE